MQQVSPLGHIRLARLLWKRNIARSGSTIARWQSLESLKNPCLIDFQEKAFRPLRPYHLISSFDLPASSKWVHKTVPATLNTACFQPFQDEVYLPMELTMQSPSNSFSRAAAPLSVFLDYLRQMDSNTSSQSSLPQMYIAQAPLSLLPPELLKDVPTPDLVLKAGKGDIYNSSLWAGLSDAARTPLHRDPNPNILIQVSGTKTVRLLPPEVGARVYSSVQDNFSLDSAPTEAIGTMRGEEMMGPQGRKIDQVIWKGLETLDGAREAVLSPGDGIFIPNGWWHSIRSFGSDFNISINWWFR